MRVVKKSPEPQGKSRGERNSPESREKEKNSEEKMKMNKEELYEQIAKYHDIIHSMKGEVSELKNKLFWEEVEKMQ